MSKNSDLRQINAIKLLFMTMLILCLSFTALKAQSDFNDYTKQQQDLLKDFEKEYDEYVKAEQEAFNKFVEEVTRKWNEFKNSTQRDWYDYSRDLNTLSRVDFEEGKITIETLVEKDTDDVIGQAKKNIREKVVRLFNKDSLTGNVILENQVEFNSPPIVDSINIETYIDEKVLPNLTIERETIKSSDGIERVKITAIITMVPNHLRIRAEKYLPDIKKYCREFDLDIPLVLAIIQTESYFNQYAKSPVPAFGLMQLVPKYGAREAYKYVYKEDRIIRPAYLYQPENNIQLGCAYLAKMREYEFKDIKDIDKLRYCLIASYNTGPGNLSLAITGKRKLNIAIIRINEMDKDALFRKLKKELPYEETRDYIVKVETRRGNYVEWQ